MTQKERDELAALRDEFAEFGAEFRAHIVELVREVSALTATAKAGPPPDHGLHARMRAVEDELAETRGARKFAAWAAGFACALAGTAVALGVALLAG